MMKHPKTYSLPASLSSSSSALPSRTSPSGSKVPHGGSGGITHVSLSGARLFGPPSGDIEFVELIARSNFSFLQGGSHPEEMVLYARTLGYKGLAVCDVNGLYGIVRGYQAIEKPSAFDVGQMDAQVFEGQGASPKKKFRYLFGTELTPYDASPVVLLPMNKDGYASLCRLITAAKRRAPKGHFVLSLQHILEANENMIAFPLPPWKDADLVKLQDGFQDRIYLPVHRDFTWESVRLYQHALRIEQTFGIPLFATQRPLFHEPGRKPLHDVLTCILHKTTIEEAATRLTLNSERHLKPLPDLAHLFRERPDLLRRTMEIAGRLEFSLSEIKYRYPQEHLPPGKSATEFLRELVEKGLRWRYPPARSKPETLAKARKLMEHELAVIRELEYEDYFLTLWDVCVFARKRGILHQGRGSAANSIICFTLGLTAADPVALGFLFERFLSKRRREPPDIDIDFEHERREEVIQYIYQKYGEQRAAMVCTVIRYRSRMAVREVAKVLGVPNDKVDGLTKFMGREGLSRLMEVAGWTSEYAKTGPPKEVSLSDVYNGPSDRGGGGSGGGGLPTGGGLPAATFERALKTLPTTQGPAPVQKTVDISSFGINEKRFRMLVRLAHELQGFPRHLGIHTGGFVISNGPLVDIVPVEAATMDGRFVVQWNKDDINALGLMKVDVLSLGMLTAIQKAFMLLRSHKKIAIDMASVPHNDKGTYEMIQKADTVGVFQIESRAQMSLLPRLKPKNYYDLVIEVAIVRPGPIQGGMVHPFLRRRSGKEKVVYAHECLRPILSKTMGVPLFQEQVMQIAVEAAGFSPEESDDLRRIMSSAWRKRAVMGNIRQRVVSGMLSRGIAQEYAEQIYKTIEGFASYGFPESHAASFALITYVSCYLKHNHPEVFVCSLLNSQPMGFYSPRQLIADAQRHGVRFLALDVQRSDWNYTLENTGSGLGDVRVGMRSIHGIREEHACAIVAERSLRGPFRDLTDLVRRTKIPRATLVRLAAAGALASFGANPRQTLWTLQGMSFDERSLFFGAPVGLDFERDETEGASLPRESDWEKIRRDYQSKGFAIDSHPLAVLRPSLAHSGRRYTTAKELESLKHQTPVRIAGLMSLLQKPPTAKGMCFISLEDETGLMNVVITPDIYQQARLLLLNCPLLDIEGRLESREGVRNIKAARIRPVENPHPPPSTLSNF